ncbi:hypothetical protein HDF16_005131 [Granulicella aggregans]|uniref:Uncharacterized protein n=1 Tax=Granulicella aggregans TaxID=474949 RepID=A0A7W8E7L5_9BACT|nr:hypothetical protein [Granulicella aggregans]
MVGCMNEVVVLPDADGARIGMAPEMTGFKYVPG